MDATAIAGCVHFAALIMFHFLFPRVFRRTVRVAPGEHGY